LFARVSAHLKNESVWLPLIAVFSLSVLIVSPHGEFPLNDDWIHARVVQNLLEQGRYGHHPYVTATLVAQAYWGGIFASLFGFNFTVLRVSTLVLGVVGGWAVSRAALTLGVGRGLALVAGVIAAANPLMLNLSYSFMTDVPFLAMCSLSGWCFLVFLQRRDARWLVPSSAFSVLAFLTRQTGVMVSAAAFVVLLVAHRRGTLRLGPRLLAAFGAPWLVGAVIYLWLSTLITKETPMLLGPRTALVETMEGLRYFPILFAYLGFLSLPLIFVLPWQRLAGGRGLRGARLWLLGFLGVCGGLLVLPRVLLIAKVWLQNDYSPWLARYPIRMPLLGYDYIRDLAVSFPHLPNETPQPLLSIGGWWWLITVGAVLVASSFFVGVLRTLRVVSPRDVPDSKGTPAELHAAQRLFLLVWFVLATASLFNPFRGVEVVDRYFLGGLTPFVLLVALECHAAHSRRAFVGAVAATALFWGFGLVCAQDYLAWNRTAWIAQNKLLNEYGVSSERIRGEDTFQGWHNSEAYMKRFKTRNFWAANRTRLGPWTFGDDYVVAAQETLAGYLPLERFHYRTWLGMQDRTITIFKRQGLGKTPGGGA
jgi:hypothetical protein